MNSCPRIYKRANLIEHLLSPGSVLSALHVSSYLILAIVLSGR